MGCRGRERHKSDESRTEGYRVVPVLSMAVDVNAAGGYERRKMASRQRVGGWEDGRVGEDARPKG